MVVVVVVMMMMMMLMMMMMIMMIFELLTSAPGMTISELQRECGESRKEKQILLQVTSCSPCC
jgi:hypothetical protein